MMLTESSRPVPTCGRVISENDGRLSRNRKMGVKLHDKAKTVPHGQGVARHPETDRRFRKNRRKPADDSGGV